MTNKEQSVKDKVFINACESIGIEPTKRQYSKHRLGKGKLFAAYGKNLPKVTTQ